MEQAEPPNAESSNLQADADIVTAYLRTVDFETVSLNTVLKYLMDTHGRNFDKKFVKALIEEFTPESIVEQQAASIECEEEEQDPLQGMPDWQGSLNEVVWVRTSKQWPWYAAIIIHPFQAPKEAQKEAISSIGKRHTIYYYKNGMTDFASADQMRPYLEFKEAALAMVDEKKYVAKHKIPVTEGVEIADEDIMKPKDARIGSKFAIQRLVDKKRKRPASKAKPAAIKKPKTTSDMSGLSVPRPAAAPDPHPAVGQVQEKKIPKPVTPKTVTNKPAKQPPADETLVGPDDQEDPPSASSESEAEAEFDFKDDDEDYGEPAKKKVKSGPPKEKETKKERKEERKKSKSSGLKKSKPTEEKSSKPSNSEKAKNASAAPPSKPKPPTAKPIIPVAKATLPADETNEMRAKRLLGLLSKSGHEASQSGFTPALKDKILKFMDKLLQMKLTVQEIKATQAMEIVNGWRKHADADIMQKAKDVRAAWKEFAQQSGTLSATPGPSIPKITNTDQAPAADTPQAPPLVQPVDVASCVAAADSSVDADLPVQDSSKPSAAIDSA